MRRCDVIVLATRAIEVLVLFVLLLISRSIQYGAKLTETLWESRVLEEHLKTQQNTSTVNMSSRKCSGDGTPDRRYIEPLEIRYTIAPSGDLLP